MAQTPRGIISCIKGFLWLTVVLSLVRNPLPELVSNSKSGKLSLFQTRDGKLNGPNVARLGESWGGSLSLQRSFTPDSWTHFTVIHYAGTKFSMPTIIKGPPHKSPRVYIKNILDAADATHPFDELIYMAPEVSIWLEIFTLVAMRMTVWSQCVGFTLL